MLILELPKIFAKYCRLLVVASGSHHFLESLRQEGKAALRLRILDAGLNSAIAALPMPRINHAHIILFILHYILSVTYPSLFGRELLCSPFFLTPTYALSFFPCLEMKSFAFRTTSRKPSMSTQPAPRSRVAAPTPISRSASRSRLSISKRLYLCRPVPARAGA